MKTRDHSSKMTPEEEKIEGHITTVFGILSATLFIITFFFMEGGMQMWLELFAHWFISLPLFFLMFWAVAGGALTKR